jgi:hypothetical protein
MIAVAGWSKPGAFIQDIAGKKLKYFASNTTKLEFSHAIRVSITESRETRRLPRGPFGIQIVLAAS